MLRKAHLDVDVDGTSLQGYVNTTYAELVKAFGEPSHDGDGYKTDAEWVLRDGDKVVSIYNWKDGPNYCGRDGTPVTDITEWHIGGHGPDVVDLVQEALPTAKTRKGWL